MKSVMQDSTDRLYPQELPEVGDTVIVKINKIEDSMAYGTLIEYNREGMVPRNALSHKKVWNMRQVLQIGRQEYMEVSAVDTEKGYIDLSKKHVRDEEIEECKNRYGNAKKMWSFFNRWSNKAETNLVEDVLWKSWNNDSGEFEIKPDQREWIEELDPDQQDSATSDYAQLFETHETKHELKVELVSYAEDAVSVLQQVLGAAADIDPQIKCVYTGRLGDFGSIYIFSYTDKSEKFPNVLTRVSDLIQTMFSDKEGKVAIEELS